MTGLRRWRLGSTAGSSRACACAGFTGPPNWRAGRCGFCRRGISRHTPSCSRREWRWCCISCWENERNLMSALTYIFLLPLLAAVALAFVPRAYAVVMRGAAVGVTFVTMLLAVLVFVQFSGATADDNGYKFVTHDSGPGRQLAGDRLQTGCGRDQRGPGADGRGCGVCGGVLLVGNPREREGILHPAAGDDGRDPGRVRCR